MNTDYLSRMPHQCELMRSMVPDESVPIAYSPRLREYHLRLVDQEAVQRIYYCPWCGSPLPKSLREEFFARLDAMGIDDWDDCRIPASMRSDEWWRLNLHHA